MRCIGIIMDGNRRWAQARGLPTASGHRAGYDMLKKALVWAKETELKTVYLYAFSTENWNRSAEEVHQLMELFRWALVADAEFFRREQLKIKFIGDLARLSHDLQEGMRRLEESTAAYDGLQVVFALSYGGRAELAAAAERLRGSQTPITEETFASALWTAGLPDPEVIIRTGHSRRLSNFLPWQSAYADIIFLDLFWPDLTREAFHSALASVNPEDRRFGR